LLQGTLALNSVLEHVNIIYKTNSDLPYGLEMLGAYAFYFYEIIIYLFFISNQDEYKKCKAI
jgi:hypothetical protein